MTELEAPALKRKPLNALLPVALGGILTLLAFIAILMWGQHKNDALFFYSSDDTLLDLAIGDGWVATGSPHAGVDAVPLQQNAL